LPDAVSVVSRTLQRHYLDHHGVSATYIPNGVNPASTPAPQPSEIRKLGLLGRDYFLFVGRLSPEKGCDVLIDAYRGLAGRAKLAIAGGSSYSDAYVKRLRASTPPGVLFLGPVRGRLLSELYAHAAAFVLPSTIEGLSVSLLEAMAHGCCVIASNIPENLELAGDAGWTVPPKDVAALGAALSRVLEQPAEAARLGNLARRRVEAEYTWDRTARRTEALFYELLGRPVEKDVDSTLPASPAEDGRIPAA
jgi:glycosyltransferase involved in cell wall biosynthesis